MDLFVRFLYDFLSLFFGGIKKIFLGLFEGIKEMFNIPKYYEVVKNYSEDLTTKEWIMVVLAVLCLLIILGTIIFLIILGIKKYIRLRKSLVEQEELLEEVADLNRDVLKLTKEKDKIMAMKVSQLGLKPDESETLELNEEQDKKDEVLKQGESRFSKLSQIDLEYKDYKLEDYHNTFTLPELCETFRNFAASKLGLYYKIDMVRLFVSAIASTRLVILQGISGTGKTSLAYAWGKFLKNDSTIASVQPSWRDRTELFGYFNEFTKKFNETDVLKKMYEAGYNDKVYITVLDEMNIARVEYYFAEMLSILELPNKEDWKVDIVSAVWDNDPCLIDNGSVHIPDNVWFVGTINNDDSTFAVADKVYDRAVPIDLDSRAEAFQCEDAEPITVSTEYMEELFKEAREQYSLSAETEAKLEALNDFLIKNFKLAFGNRIIKQTRDFVPVYIACGGTELEAVDFMVAKKVLRKFESLSLGFMKDQLTKFESYLDKLFGRNKMSICKEYMEYLKKNN